MRISGERRAEVKKAAALLHERRRDARTTRMHRKQHKKHEKSDKIRKTFITEGQFDDAVKAAH